MMAALPIRASSGCFAEGSAGDDDCFRPVTVAECSWMECTGTGVPRNPSRQWLRKRKCSRLVLNQEICGAASRSIYAADLVHSVTD